MAVIKRRWSLERSKNEYDLWTTYLAFCIMNDSLETFLIICDYRTHHSKTQTSFSTSQNGWKYIRRIFARVCRPTSIAMYSETTMQEIMDTPV